MPTDDDQAMLSAFDAGDTDDLDLSLPEDGIDVEARREVREYATEISTGGWEVVDVTSDLVAFWNPDGYETYRIKRKSAGWHGIRGDRQVTPSYTDDLQAALDAAGEFMADNPVERDE